MINPKIKHKTKEIEEDCDAVMAILMEKNEDGEIVMSTASMINAILSVVHNRIKKGLKS